MSRTKRVLAVPVLVFLCAVLVAKEAQSLNHEIISLLRQILTLQKQLIEPLQ